LSYYIKIDIHENYITFYNSPTVGTDIDANDITGEKMLVRQKIPRGMGGVWMIQFMGGLDKE